MSLLIQACHNFTQINRTSINQPSSGLRRTDRGRNLIADSKICRQSLMRIEAFHMMLARTARTTVACLILAALAACSGNGSTISNPSDHSSSVRHWVVETGKRWTS
jgi:hypothetical protein